MSERSAPDRHRIGTAVMLGGTLFSIVTVYLFQVVSSRTLGPDAFAPVGVLWTVMFLVFTIAMIPVEQFITRRLVHDGGSVAGLAENRWVVLGVFALAVLVGTGFVVATLDLFFDGDPRWVALAVVMFANRSVLATARGFLAGRWRFVRYGLAAAVEGIALFALGALAAIVAPTALAFAAAMTLAPLSVLILRPFGATVPVGEPPDEALVGAGTAFLGFYIVAAAASQLILAGGPIVVGFIGGTAAQISIYFITFTLFRGPITSSYNLIARVLPDFTRLSAEREFGLLASWSRRFAITGAGLVVAGFIAAWLLGPWIITLLYGAEFAPDPLAAALGGAAVGAGLAALFSGQVLVARGRTEILAASWMLGLAAAGLAVILLQTDPVTRVAAGFAAGEIGALVALTVFGLLTSGERA